MIDQLQVVNFKRFRRLSLGLGHLTVLTGLNGSGKSTVVQALLLAHQASLGDGKTVPLVGDPGLDLGQAADVLHYDAESSAIEVLMGQAGEYQWSFDSGPAGQDDMPYLQVLERPSVPPPPVGSSGSAFTFLSAERLGPRTSHPTSPSEPDNAVVGEDGRYVAHALAVNPRRDVAVQRRHPSAGDVTTLGVQAEAWLSQLVGPTQLEASILPRTGLATLRIRTPGRSAEWMLPTNTGFGVSYSLPVVVAGLLAPPGALLIVDSPEAHLHPAAQSALGEFLSVVAGSGVQVIVETHSDHVLNGIRKSVAADRTLSAELVRIIFFGADTEPALLHINDRGGIDEWPPGFFDQIDRDLGVLTRLRRRGPANAP